jgi:hypothetical protein
VAGIIGHYSGETIEQLATKKDVPSAFFRAWLVMFRDMGPAMKAGERSEAK